MYIQTNLNVGLGCNRMYYKWLVMPFVEPKINPKYFLKFYHRGQLCFCQRTKNSELIANNETNPFRLKFFGVYEFILKRILSLRVICSWSVFAAFKPKIPRYLVKKALFNHVYHETLD